MQPGPTGNFSSGEEHHHFDYAICLPLMLSQISQFLIQGEPTRQVRIVPIPT
ncbi:MAG: hypothetical protein ACR2NU_00480 [Aeoliella sp.]